MRAGFIGATSGWYLANLDASGIDGLSALLERRQLERTARMLGRRAAMPSDEAAVLTRFHWAYERGVIDSVERFASLAPGQRAALEARLAALASAYGSGGEPGARRASRRRLPAQSRARRGR